MRVSLNLARAPSFRERYGLWLAVPGALVTFALLVWMAVSALSTYRQLKSVQAARAKLQSRQQGIERKASLLKGEISQPATQDLLNRTSYVNSLIASRRFSLADLTNKVSALLPKDVRLDTLALESPGEKPTIRFTVEGKTEPSIESFLVNLENSNDFTNVIVTSQRLSGETSDAGLVAASCTAVYLDTAIPEGMDKNFNARKETPIHSPIR